VERWHTAAVPIIRTKDFAATWREFADGWLRVDSPLVAGSLDWALERATVAGAPPEAEQYRSPRLQLLAALCQELAKERPDRGFFLSCRDAARMLDLGGEQSQATAWRMLRRLCDPKTGLFQQTASGNFADRRANEYRYVGELWGRKAPCHA
jgi:hypothetical protein